MRRYLNVLLVLFVVLLSSRGFAANGLIKVKAKKSCRVVSYNLHGCIGMDGKQDYDRTAEVIARFGADMVALQEVDSMTNRSGNSSNGGELAKRLDMHFTFAPAISFGGGKYGVGLLSKERPIRYEYMPLPGREEERVLLVVEFKKYYMAVTHLSLTKEDRVESAKIIAEKAQQLQDKPIILCGDFNATPQSETIAIFNGSFQALSNPSNHTFPVVDPDRTIDYIYASRGKRKHKVTSHAVISETIASDHLPLYVDLILK